MAARRWQLAPPDGSEYNPEDLRVTGTCGLELRLLYHLEITMNRKRTVFALTTLLLVSVARASGRHAPR